MLRVTVELVPYGMESWKKRLLLVEISNEGKNGTDPSLYDYSVEETDEYGMRGTPVKGIDRNVPVAVFLADVLSKTR